MIPYFSDDSVTIYHGDCRDILPTLEPVDLVLTDPPYGIDYQSNRRVVMAQQPKIVGDKAFPVWLFDVLHPSSAMLVFCRWDVLLTMPKPKSFIVWDKGVHGSGDLRHEYGRRWEGCAFYPGWAHGFSHRPQDIIAVPRIPSAKLLHPTEKPLELCRRLLEPNVGTLVLDPFMGVGATLLAAKDLGRKAIGIEIEERYCEIAAKRMSQSVMALTP